jgi:hypothetical protein
MLVCMRKASLEKNTEKTQKQKHFLVETRKLVLISNDDYKD